MKHAAGALFLLGLCFPGFADWPMAGHDPQRTSAAIEDEMPDADQLVWFKKIVPFISTKVQIVTSSAANLIYIATVDGVYALNPENGSDVWRYLTPMPVSHSPTVADGVLYIACHDNTIHAVDAKTGAKIWQSGSAGAGFDVNPLVVEGRVYAGSRDGFFYCFDVRTGDCLWTYQAEGPITFSAAYAAGTVYFAGLDCRVYAVDAASGKQVWKTDKLHGEGFYSWWPTIVADRVLVPGSSNHGFEGRRKLVNQITREEIWEPGAATGEFPGPLGEDGFFDATKFVVYQQRLPHVQTFFVLDQKTGRQTDVAPFLYVGNPSGTRHPPAVGPDQMIYAATVTAYKDFFPCQGFCGWRLGTVKLFPLDPRSTESGDETRAHSIIGKSLYWLHKNDQGGQIMNLAGGIRSQLENYGEDYHTGYADFNCGDYPPDSDGVGTHGNQNPPVPLNGRVYFHRSNAVVCYGPKGSARVMPDPALPREARPTAATVPRLPNVVAPEALLAEQVRRMIDGGHLRFLDANCSEHYYAFRGGFGDMLNHYWRNPAETIYTLCRALPHVPDDLKEPLRQYIQSEWRLYPPTKVQYMKWEGANRQYALVPDEPVDERRMNQTSPFPGWKFNPFNYYACWKYAEAGLGDAKAILAELPKPTRYPDEEFGAALPLRGLPHVLNCYIAGYHGYLNLLAMAGQDADPALRTWLDEAQARRAEYLKDQPNTLHAVEAGGFKYLVPELGDYIHRTALEDARVFVDTYDRSIAPLWFVARADEVTRMTKNHLGTSTKFAEGSTSHYYEYWSLFQAKALALQESRAELEEYLDAPAVERGDLYYIQNLCAVLEAD